MPIDPSYFASAYPFSVIRDKLRRHSGPTLDFALGRHREPPPEWLPDFVQQHAVRALSRRGDDELETLIAAVVDMFDSVYGARVAPEQLLAAPSGRAAMAGLAAVFIDPDDTVLVTEPGYPAFARLAAQRHARLAVVPLDPRRDFVPDLNSIDTLNEPSAIRLAALNYPNNPTGAVIEPTAFAALRERLGEGCLLFNDAIYGPLTFGPNALSLMASEFRCAVGDVIELHSLGKLFSIGPLGAAFLVGPAESIAEIGKYGDFAWTQLSSLQARVSARCLADWGYAERRRDDLERRLADLREIVSGLGLEPYPVQAGMYLLCRAPSSVAGRPVAGAGEAADALLEQYGLVVAPWDVGGDGYLRFCAAFTAPELDALADLGRIAD